MRAFMFVKERVGRKREREREGSLYYSLHSASQMVQAEYATETRQTGIFIGESMCLLQQPTERIFSQI